MATTATSSAANSIIGNNGRNLLVGTSGDDYIDGGAGSDILYGADGNDILVYDSNDFIINGGAGFDTLRFGTGGQTVTLGTAPGIGGIEAIDFAASGNQLSLTSADVERVSDTDGLTITGDHGNLINPGSGWQLDGFSFDGRFYEFSQAGMQLSTETSVQITGFNRATTTVLSVSDDVWFSEPISLPDDSEYVQGGDGDDQIFSTTAMAQLFGDAGNDLLVARRTGSVLHGGDGNDTLFATSDVVMYGDAGADTINFFPSGVHIGYGGAGADRFDITCDLSNVDFRIGDFNAAEGDTLRLLASGFVFGPEPQLQLQLIPMSGNDSACQLKYIDDSSIAHTLVTLMGTHLELSDILPSIVFQ